MGTVFDIIGIVLMLILGAVVVVLYTFCGWLGILACWASGDPTPCYVAHIAYWIYGIEGAGLAIFYLCGGGGVLAKIVQRIHYIVSPHPAARVAKKSRGGRPLDGRALSAAMAKSHDETLAPAFVSKNRARQARAAAERLRAEAELMDAAVDRERARGRRDSGGE